MTIIYDTEQASVLTDEVSAPSRISILTEDILWFIFMKNTGNLQFLDVANFISRATSPRPLVTTRLSSQVCQEWRNIILQSSSIWGRLIDFTSFNQKTDHWRNEVLSRSGTSLLWVNADNLRGRNRDFKRLFLFRLLNEHWERIEKLFVALPYEHVGDIQTAVERAAPNLETFILRTGDHNRDLSRFSGTMFARCAPHLKYFQTLGTHCTLEAAWASDIRQLSLGRQFNNEEVCKVLHLMPFLESLDLDGHTIVNTYRPPHIYLPRLGQLRVADCLQYIGHIDAAPGCSLQLELKRSHLTSEMLRSYDSHIKKLLHSYLSYHPVEHLYVEWDEDVFNLSDRPFPECSTLPYEENIFEIAISPFLHWPNHWEPCLDIFTTPRFASVSKLVLIVEFEIEPRALPIVKDFLSHFVSVECIQVTEIFIGHLLKDVMTDSILFPNLKTLQIVGLERSNFARPWINSLHRFLAMRRDLGYPIRTLDLTGLKENIWRNLDALEEFMGLKVVSCEEGNEVVYECGSGHSEALRFYARVVQRALPVDC